jgi:hypothetical protein
MGAEGSGHGGRGVGTGGPKGRDMGADPRDMEATGHGGHGTWGLITAVRHHHHRMGKYFDKLGFSARN